MRVKALLAFLVFALVPRAFAAGLPDLGDPASAVLSPQVELRIGEKIAREIRADPTYLDDPEVDDYLDTIGNRLVAAMPSPYPRFHFLAIRDPSINAFAVPGGFVGVNTGLITATDDESELAAVLGHEITHVTQNHIARMLSAQKKMELPAMLALAAAIIAGQSRPDLAMGAAAATQAGLVASRLHYSREFEREADRLGFERMVKAGFDPRAMGQFFKKLERYTRLSADGGAPSWLQDHPMTTARIADAENRAANYPYRQYVDSVAYGLVRAKLRAEQGDPRDAVQRLTNALHDGRYANEADARYGLVVALLRDGAPQRAKGALAKLEATGVKSPMIDTLSARIDTALGERGAAIGTLKSGLARYPAYRPLSYAAAEALERGGHDRQALAVVSEGLAHHPQDRRLYALRAKAYAALGKQLLQHQAQAEAYYLEGSLAAAIEQLRLARAAGDGNFYQLSIVDARLRDLRRQRKLEQQDPNPIGN